VFTFKLTDEAGEETTLKADSRDVLVWEKTSRSNERYMDLLTEMSMVKFYRLAHIAAKRQAVFTGKLADFETAYVLGIETEEVDPTTAGASSET
jgi:hypothetical protein